MKSSNGKQIQNRTYVDGYKEGFVKGVIIERERILKELENMNIPKIKLKEIKEKILGKQDE